jgi:hypothetical protein
VKQPVTLQMERQSPVKDTAAEARTSLSRTLGRFGVAGYLLLLCATSALSFRAAMGLPWFSSSDENVVVGEVIRFNNIDFHQRFFDMPGTPLMLICAVEWRLFYFGSVVFEHFQRGSNLFAFQHLQELFVLSRITSLGCFLLSALLLFRIAARVSNKYAGAAAATILLMSPAYVETAASLRVEPLAMCCMLGAIVILTECRWQSGPFWAGILGGIGIACRLHSITVIFPVLFLVLVQQTWARRTEFTSSFRRMAFCLAAVLFSLSALLFYFFHFARSPLKTGYPLAFALLSKFSVATCVLAPILVLLYVLPVSRRMVVNTVTPASLALVVGVVLGLAAGMFTVFIQYKELLRSLNFYLGPGYRDPIALQFSLYDKLASFLSFYIKVIAPDRITLILLCSGAFLVISLRRWRFLWPYLLVGIGFALSKPLDLARSSHHVALWMPFYAMLCGVPIAVITQELEARGSLGRYLALVAALSSLLLLRVELKHNPEQVLSVFTGHAERLANVEHSRAWIATHTAPQSSFMIAFYCFGPEVFYSWFREMGLTVPQTADDREYVIWWGNQSALKGRSGYACVSPSDLPFMKQWELRQAGEGIDPLHDNRFRLVQPFGNGSNEIDILQFDNAATVFKDGPPKDLTFHIGSALRLDSIVLVYDKAKIQGTSPIVVTTAPEQWSYAASIPIVMDRTPGSKRMIHIRSQVVAGQIGLGILNRNSGSFESEEIIGAEPGPHDRYIPIPSPDKADDLVLRNTSGRGESKIAVEETEILTRATPAEPITRLDDIGLACDKASIERGQGVTITTAPEQWAFAASAPIHPKMHGLMLRIRARIIRGAIGFGVLVDGQKSFLVEQSYRSSRDPIEVFLPLPQPGVAGRLIIRSTAPSGTASSAVLEALDTWELD